MPPALLPTRDLRMEPLLVKVSLVHSVLTRGGIAERCEVPGGDPAGGFKDS